MKNNTIKIKAFLCLLLLTCGWVSVQAQQVLTDCKAESVEPYHSVER